MATRKMRRHCASRYSASLARAKRDSLHRTNGAERRRAAPALRLMRKLGIALLIVLGLVSTALLWWPDTSPLPATNEPAAGAGEQPAGPTAAVAEPTIPRERAPRLLPTEPPPKAVTAQGLRGLVVDATGQPLPGVDVHLLDAASNEPLQAGAQSAATLAPLASTLSDSNGAFAVGLPVVQERQYELCFVSSAHALLRSGPYRLLVGEWHDLGAIVLQSGAMVRGRVTMAGRNDIPVPNATIRIEVGSTFADAVLQALPADAPGLVARSNGSGDYEIGHAPSRGTVTITAVAPGFARVQRRDVVLRGGSTVQVDFELPTGQSLFGSVVDELGAPIETARVQAWTVRSPGAPLWSPADARGVFAIHGLLPETYRVRAEAPGFEPAELLPVAPGSRDLRLVLAARGAIRLRVMTPEGSPLRSYRVALRRTFAGPPAQLGNVPEVPERQVHLGPAADVYELTDVPAGVFLVEVTADGLAKSFSREIDHRRDPTRPPPPRWHDVDVAMSPGAMLRGRVLAEDGTPLAGATVATERDGVDPDSPLQGVLGKNLPERVTRTSARTDAFGEFVLPQLAAGDYQLQVDHPEACRELVRGIAIAAGEERAVPPIRLPRGAEIVGRATYAGQPAGQIRVVLTKATTSGQRGGLRLEAVTDSRGDFRLPARVPPGEYVLRGAVVGGAEPEAQIAQQLLQLQRSSTNVSVPPGQALVQRDLDIPPAR